MPHTSDILQYLSSKSHLPGVNKFADIIEEILKQLRDNQLDLAASIIYKHVSKKINTYGMLRQATLYAILTKVDSEIIVTDYINQAVAEFTQDEESSILGIIGSEFVKCYPKNLFNVIFGNVFYELTRLG